MYRPSNCLFNDGIWLDSSTRSEHELLLESSTLPATHSFSPVELISNNFYDMGNFEESSCLSSPSSSFGSLSSASSFSSPTYQLDTFSREYRKANLLLQQKGSDPSLSIKSKIEGKNFNCHLCPRSFSRKYDLQRHVRVHTGSKPYMCLSCAKPFARTDALKRHLRMEETCKSSTIIQVMKESGNRRYQDL